MQLAISGGDGGDLHRRSRKIRPKRRGRKSEEKATGKLVSVNTTPNDERIEDRKVRQQQGTPFLASAR